MIRSILNRIQGAHFTICAWLGLGCLALCGCRPSIESIVDQYRGSVEARLVQVAAVSSLMEAAEVDGGVGFAGIALDFQQIAGELGEDFTLSPTWNAGVIHAERLKDLTGYSEELGIVIGESYFLTHARLSLDGGWWVMGDIAESVEGELRRASQIRYLFVIRTIEHKLPRSLEGEEFTGGHYRAEAICYDLEAGAPLGGFEFQAANSQSGTFSFTTSDSNVHGDRSYRKLRAIQDDLRKNVEDAFWAEVVAVCPGTKRP
jgi:hypothetical protein